MRSRLLLLPALSLLLHVHPGAAADKILIRQHWEPGKVYHFETSMDMESDTGGGPGAAGGLSTAVIQKMDVTVRKEPGTDRKLADMTFTAVKAIMNMGGQMMTYDSTDPAMSQPMLQQAFGALVGKSVTFIYDKDDKIIDVNVPEGFTPTPLGQGQGPDGKQFANLLRENVEFGLPSAPIAVGESYSADKKLEMAPLGSVTTKMKGRFDSIVNHEGRRHAKLVMDGTMEMPAAGATAAAGLGISPGTKVHSEILFDLERKVVSLNNVTTDMKMYAPGEHMGVKQKVVSTLKSIEDAPAKK